MQTPFSVVNLTTMSDKTFYFTLPTNSIQMNFTGIIIGLATFLTIGVFHPIVIKAEYYFGRRSWWAFLLFGLLALVASVLIANEHVSILLGVVGFSSLWGILEVFQQHRRVQKGWFPMNPRRAHEYNN